MKVLRIAPAGLLAALSLAAPVAAFAADDGRPMPSVDTVAAVSATLEGTSAPRQDVRKRDIPQSSALGGDRPSGWVDDEFEQYDAKDVESWWQRYQWKLEHAE